MSAHRAMCDMSRVYTRAGECLITWQSGKLNTASSRTWRGRSLLKRQWLFFEWLRRKFAASDIASNDPALRW